MLAFDPDELMEVINKILKERSDWKAKRRFMKYTEKDFINYVQYEYKDYVMKAPSLFEKVSNGSLDNPEELARLTDMISKLRAVKREEISMEDQSKQIGQEYADKYVKPIVDELDKDK
jgi:hypothetical protein